MDRIQLYQAGSVICGPGSISELPTMLQGLGIRRCLVVTTSNVKPLLEGMFAGIKRFGLDVVDAPSVDREPTVSDLTRVLECARATKPDLVIGIGGGSVMDVAKILSVLAEENRPVHEYFGTDTVPARKVVLICVPTTAGTGSEASPNAIILDEQTLEKKAIISRYLLPDYVILDPELLVSVPPRVTAATGMDALVHCIEAYTNRRAHAMVDEFALAGIRLLAAGLPRAVQNGSDLLARTQTLIGSYFGGLCLGPVGTAGVHALAYPLNGRFGIPHGVANALMLPYVVYFNFQVMKDRYFRVLRELGLLRVDDVAAITPEQTKNVLCEFVSGLGLPSRLRDVGITRETIPELAALAMRVSRLLGNNPRLITESDALAIYQLAF